MNSLHWEDLDKPNNCDSSTTLSINQCEHNIYPSYKRDSTPSYTQEWGRGRGWQWGRGERRDRKKPARCGSCAFFADVDEQRLIPVLYSKELLHVEIPAISRSVSQPCFNFFHLTTHFLHSQCTRLGTCGETHHAFLWEDCKLAHVCKLPRISSWMMGMAA